MENCCGLRFTSSVLTLLLLFLVMSLLPACAEPQRRVNLPPSASDLILLKSLKLCDPKAAVFRAHQTAQQHPWGSGEELRAAGEAPGSEASYYFDEDGTLVGALFAFPTALDLKPYRVLRRTLSELRPSLEFYLHVAAVPGE